MARADVLLVSLGSTAGLRAADAELRGALERAGARVAVAAAAPQRDVRTFALTDLVWARAARAAARAAIAEHDPRAVVYSTITAALLWPAPGAIRYDAPAAANRPGRHGVWQRPLERRRLRAAPLLVPWADGSLAETPAPHAPAVVVPIPVEPSSGAPRRPPSATSRRSPTPRTRTRRASTACSARGRRPAARARSSSWRAPSASRPPPACATPDALRPDDYRALLRRARVFVTAPRREDYGIAQLEALADGCVLVTTAGARPVRGAPARPRARPAVRADDDAGAAALRAALDDPARRLRRARAGRAGAVPPRRRRRVVRDELLPRLLAAAAAEAGGPRRPQRARLRSGANSSHGSVLATSAAVSHARRAVATPQRVFDSVFGAVRVGVDEDPHAGRAPRRARGRR